MSRICVDSLNRVSHGKNEKGKGRVSTEIGGVSQFFFALYLARTTWVFSWARCLVASRDLRERGEHVTTFLGSILNVGEFHLSSLS